MIYSRGNKCGNGAAWDLEAQAIARMVLDWYSSRGRRFAWRDTHDPYHVLVAEMLLRQTTARQVASVYPEFLAKFPTCASLATADESDVLQIVSCLGMRGRAGALREAASIIVRDFGGQVPESRVDLLRIPGVGPYTADAVLCLAFGKRFPLVDSTVHRLLIRLCKLDRSMGFRKLHRLACELAASMLPESRTKEFNLAMLDIGSTICKPVKPECSKCPLASYCCYAGGSAIQENPDNAARWRHVGR